jgi:IS4 transposase
MAIVTKFEGIMKGLGRKSFDQIVKRHEGNKYTKAFDYWQHLLVMVYAQLSGASSLREVEVGFNSQQANHQRLGARAVKRSTLADANGRRKEVVFNEVAQLLLQQVSRGIRSQSKEALSLLDSTPINLKGREFERWVQKEKTHRTQGLKLHVLYDNQAKAPEWEMITAPNVNDVTAAWNMPLRKGAIYVFDKGYCDYSWWREIDRAGACFVTRLKENAAVTVEVARPIEQVDTGEIISDEIIRLKNRHTRGKGKLPYARALRRVQVVRAGKAPLILVTNDFISSARVIAHRYKERWGIELFFKWIKQHLKIKSFLGRSEIAVRIQLLTALISYLLLALYKQSHAPDVTHWESLRFIRFTLFHRDESVIKSE